MSLTLLTAAFAPLPAVETPIVRCVLVVPPDTKPWTDAPVRLDRTIRDLQWWYSCQMEAYGYGPKTFGYETDARGKLVVHVARLTGTPPTEGLALRAAAIRTAEGLLGDRDARGGSVMMVVYNDFLWTDRARHIVAPLANASPKEARAFFNGWHYFAANPTGWRSKIRVAKLPLRNRYFPPEVTQVLHAFTPDRISTVAQRTSGGYAVIAHGLGLAFGLKPPPKGEPRLRNDLMASGFWRMRGNFLLDVRNEWCSIKRRDAAILDKNPLFARRTTGPPSTGVPRYVGMRGAIRR